MLHEFLADHRTDLIERCRAKSHLRAGDEDGDGKSEHGIPLFLDQLIKTLKLEQSAHPTKSRLVSGPSGGGKSALSEVSAAAAQHGHEMLLQGYSIDQVVHDYGDLCQSITDLAFELEIPIDVDEFRTLNRCLDNGIADAVTEFSYRRDGLVADKHSHILNERVGFLTHELRNLIQTATLAVTAIKVGNMGLGGATGAVLDRSLAALRNLVERAVAGIRAEVGVPLRYELVSVALLVKEVELSASLEAHARACSFKVSAVDPELAIDVDRELLICALGNLLQNPFKFTKPRTTVSLDAYATSDRVVFDIKDECGGLPVGTVEKMFEPFVQAATDKSGLGLGLSICRRCVDANNGVVSAQDVPGIGCIFTIALPRHAMPGPSN